MGSIIVLITSHKAATKPLCPHPMAPREGTAAYGLERGHFSSLHLSLEHLRKGPKKKLGDPSAPPGPRRRKGISGAEMKRLRPGLCRSDLSGDASTTPRILEAGSASLWLSIPT